MVTNRISSPTVLMTRPPCAVTMSVASASNRCTITASWRSVIRRTSEVKLTRSANPTTRRTPWRRLLRVGVGEHARDRGGEVAAPGVDEQRLELVGHVGELARGGLGRGEVGHGAGVGLVERRLQLGIGQRLGHQLGLPDGEPVGGAGEGPGHRQGRGLVELLLAHQAGDGHQGHLVGLGEHRVVVLDVREAQRVPELAGRQQRHLGAAGDVAPGHRGGLAEQPGLEVVRAQRREVLRAHHPVPANLAHAATLASGRTARGPRRRRPRHTPCPRW